MSCLFLWKWNEAYDLKEDYDNLLASLQYHNLIDLSGQIHRTSETLDMYQESFTQKEKNLFRDSAKEDILSLGRVGKQIQQVGNTGSDVDELKRLGILIGVYDFYTQYIYPIQSVINDIVDGEIREKSKIENISTILTEHGKELSHMIFDEQICESQMSDEEIMKRVVDIFNRINKEISELDI